MRTHNTIFTRTLSQLSIVACLILSSTLTHTTLVHASSTVPSIIINEIQIAGDKADDEFIELHNTTSTDINLHGWKIRKKTKSDTSAAGVSLIDLTQSGEKKVIIPAHGYLLWTNSKGIFASLSLPEFSSSTSFTNDATDPHSIALFDANGILQDSITWGSLPHTSPFSPSLTHPLNPPKNTSIERSITSNTLVAQEHPTPTTNARIENTPLPPSSTETSAPISNSTSSNPATTPSAIATPSSSQKTTSNAIRINEILPYPEDDAEFIELYNSGPETVNLKNWKLKDASKIGTYIFPEDTLVSPHSFFVLYHETFKFTLNNSGDTVSLFDTQNTHIQTIQYQQSQKNASYNYAENGFYWHASATPSAQNITETALEQKVKIPKKGYVNENILFEIVGKNTDEITSVVWDFGDKTKTSNKKDLAVHHTYTKKGTYTVLVQFSNGYSKKTITKKIAVKNAPQASLEIKEIHPNPIGADTGQETVALKNTGKKSIDLQNITIRTGTTFKKLSEHSFKTNLTLLPSETIILSDDIIPLSLPNTEGIIEIFQNHKDLLDTVYYEKKDGVKDGEYYIKNAQGIWEWHSSLPTPQSNEIMIHAPQDTVAQPIIQEKSLASSPHLQPIAHSKRNTEVHSQDTKGSFPPTPTENTHESTLKTNQPLPNTLIQKIRSYMHVFLKKLFYS